MSCFKVWSLLLAVTCLLLFRGAQSAQAQVIPDLPPGIELPPDVKAQLEKAKKELEALENKNKSKTPPKTQPTTPAIPKAPDTTKPNTAASAKPKGPLPPSAPASTAFQRVVKETKLGQVGAFDFTKRDNKKPRFWVSPDGKRLAYLIDKGIVVDGQKYEYANSIRQADQYVMNFRFSPDSQHTSWVIHQGQTQGAGQGETLVVDGVPEKIGWNFIANHDGGVFSRDSKHVAYTARRYAKGDVEYVLVIDGKEREVFKESPAWALTFTPNSKQVIWAKDTGDHYEMRQSSVDGDAAKVEQDFGPAQLTMNFFYGPAGEVGYIGSRKDKGEKFVVYDGKELAPTFKELKGLFLSRDGKHLAYVVEPENFRTVVVVDGKASPTYGGLEADYVKNSLALSPVGGRYAYGIEKKRREHPVIDGKEGKAYARVAEFTFSPDGQRVAHWAVQNGKLLMVVDGRESAGYDELGLPVFSPDGKTFAHRATSGNKQFIVLNGQERKSFASVGEPQFSPDGKRLVYLADLTPDGPTILADTGKEGKQYEAIHEDLYFSPQGQRLAMVAVVDGQEMVVVDGVEGQRYDQVITLGGGKVAFDDEQHWRYLAVKEGQAVLVEEAIAP